MKKTFSVALLGSAFSLGMVFGAVAQVNAPAPPWAGTVYPYGASIGEGDHLRQAAPLTEHRSVAVPAAANRERTQGTRTTPDAY